MAVGILVVILGILAIAIRGTSEPEPVGVTGGGTPADGPSPTKPATLDAASRRDARGVVDANVPRAPREGARAVPRTPGLGAPPDDGGAARARRGPRVTGALAVREREPDVRGPVSLRGVDATPPLLTTPPGRTAKAATEPEGAGPAPEREPPAGTGPTSYEVREGDTLWGLCRRWFGEGDVARQIQIVRELNPALDPDHIVVGQTLVMPEKDAVPTDVVTKPVTQRDGRLYEVRKGDTLSGIASAQLGDGSRWKEIYDLNRDRLSSPSVLHVGATILLPRE